jgi:hypothetical protein
MLLTIFQILSAIALIGFWKLFDKLIFGENIKKYKKEQAEKKESK